MISFARKACAVTLGALMAFGASVLGQSALGDTDLALAKPIDPSEIKSRTERLPKRLEGVDVQEQLETQVPQGLLFTNEDGKHVLYRDAVVGKVPGGKLGLPTILTLNYSDCPMLCSLQLNALVDSLKQIDLTLGQDYRIVTVALDPNETPQTAGKTKRRYLTQYGRPEADRAGWTVLTGSDANIHAVARALGFSYNYNEKRDEYVHPAAFVLTTPDGTVARYIYGLEYHPETLRLSLIESSEGKIGSSIDRLVLYCFHYDASEGKYAPVAMNIMRVVGGGFALALIILLAVLWRGERRKKTGSAAAHAAGKSHAADAAGQKLSSAH